MLKIELGCGANKRVKDAVGVDIISAEGVDVVSDALQYLKDMPDESIDEIHAYHFFAHCAELAPLLRVIALKLKTNGTLHASVPHFSNPYQWSDPTHVRVFGLYSFDYYLNSNVFKRKVPQYCNIMSLAVERCDLVFKAERPFYLRYLVGRILTSVVGINPLLAEFYEAYLTRVISCYEISLIARKA